MSGWFERQVRFKLLPVVARENLTPEHTLEAPFLFIVQLANNFVMFSVTVVLAINLAHSNIRRIKCCHHN